ncbi:scavenger receptor cysteine-rich type 1 protein M130-like [Saccostrea echinata]|uniref:scavenger receptor cysteine-rich type 1 protein M130-like n=1 Tax=Saccostrea echinata TaxID=191078 RepID=UPI002A7F9887|nr:scavenger receptor cysteine-rich type 1 protein M130-like [Saccostrea echinata]
MVAKQTTYRGTSGTPQIYRYNKWGYICDIGFDKDDAKVACRELGLPTKYVRVASGIFRRSTRIHLINVICNGDEETLSDCYEKYTYHYFCHGYIVVWISCDSGKQFCFYFDYFLYGRGSIRISTIDISHLESTVADLSGSQQKWTTKDTQINGKKLIHKIKIRMEERTAIDRIIVAGSRCVCSNWTFGQNCDKCACVRMHTQSCDKTTGACLCKKGFTGDACQCEANGKPCLRGVRLVNGNTTNMGRVEVVTEGIWSTVCDGNWDDNDATVVCKQLGLGNSGIAMKNAAFGKGVGPIHVDKFACKGDENDLLKCSFTRSSCDHSDDAGVVCVNQSNIIRLRDGTDRTNGRLEIKLDESGSWGRVCSQRFGESDARVACRQLGLPTRSVEAKTYAPGSGTILLTRLGCNGDEDAIQLCYGIRNPSSCRYYDDAGISCSNDCPSFTYGKECEDDCNCDRSNSLSCDKDTGECMCKSGWSGTRCTCERRIKCDENSYCDGFKCLCNDGFFRKPTNCSDVTDVLYSCSFETDFETCSIKNYGLMQWTKHYNGTPSYNTGPYRAKEGIYYVYTEASSQSTGNKGVMKIPVSNLNFSMSLWLFE